MRNCFLFSDLIVKTAIRDKLLHAIAAVGVLLVVLIPLVSLFSMRQVQELAIAIATSASSFILLIVTLLLGSSSVWRDIERKYTHSLLGMPFSRTSYLLGKYIGSAAVVSGIALLLGGVSLIAIKIAAAQYKSDLPLLWGTVITAMFYDTLKNLLLLAVAFFFSALSTSYYFSFFVTIAIYMAGTATQDVYEYMSGSYGNNFSPSLHTITKALYFLLPNLQAFNLKVYAIYSLPLNLGGLCLTFLYFIIYTGIILMLSSWAFSRRELM
ncbi:ABC transporter permease [Geotalea sp. SG265]|uniref:ABC transporter permease n=1 Tax=Geotalea sp. SG265 TaxID=2922867 RepID=UPI001FAFA46F|nr:ABC transporter permease [Geotalea sp. SG265]